MADKKGAGFVATNGPSDTKKPGYRIADEQLLDSPPKVDDSGKVTSDANVNAKEVYRKMMSK